MTRPSRGSRDQLAAPAAPMPNLRPGHNHRPRTPTQAGSWRAPRLDLGAARPMPTVQENLHRGAYLVAAVWPLQLRLPPPGVGRRLGSQAGAVLPGRHTITG